MSKFLHCGRWNKNYKFILLTAIFAFFTNYIFGYIFNDYLEEITGRHVDMIRRHKNLTPFFLKQVERDGVRIF